MAAVFSFSTTTVGAGHTMRIYSTSTNWTDYMPGDATGALLTVTSYISGEAIFAGGAASFTKSLTAASLVDDFTVDVTALEMFGTDMIIPDCILNVKIDITNTATDTYTSVEVFYYNAWVMKSEVCYSAVNQIYDINSTEIKYASMVNMLYQGLLSDIVVGNTSGIYEKLDIFNRLSA